MSLLMTRFVGAMRLDAHVYEAIEADPDALLQASGVVALAAIAGGLALAGSDANIGTLFGAVAAAFVGWLAWAALVCSLGVHVFAEPQTRADVGELARTVGFSAAPGVLLTLLALPAPQPVRLALCAVIAAWMTAAMVVAVRQALDFTRTSRAVAVCVAAWGLASALLLVAGFAFGVRAS